MSSAGAREMAPGALDGPADAGTPDAATRLVYLRDVALHLVRREIAARHRDSVLGWFWSLAPAGLQLAATYFVFTRVIPLNVENYPIFLLTGILAWSWFSRGVSLATTTLEANRSLVLRPGFPAALLPVVAVLVALVDYLLALPVLLLALAFTTGLTAETALLPLLLLVQLVLTVGLGFLFAPLQVFFRDVQHIVSIALAIGWWVTPVFYRARQVPDEFSFLYRLNPIGRLIEAQREALLGGVVPSALVLGLVALASVGVLAAGAAVFAACRARIPEQL